MSALETALDTIDAVAGEGDLVPARAPGHQFELESAGEPIALPDGRLIYPPRLHGRPIDELACALLDMDDPARSTFLRLIGPPGAGKSQIARAIAHRLWTQRGRAVEERHGSPFYGFVELQPGPSSDEYFFRYDYVPLAGAGGQVTLVDSAFVQAMREGWMVMIDEVNTARDVCLLSINATLDGRLCLYLAATGETVIAQPGFAVLLAYNPGLVGATDIPTPGTPASRPRSRCSSNWPALAALGAPAALVGEAMRARPPADRRRRRPGLDTAVPRHRGAVADDRAHRRAPGAGVLCLQPAEQVQAGKLQDAEAAAACRMLDQAGYAHLKVSAVGRAPEPARLPAGGDRLMAATRTRPAVFVSELHRASAQRGRLDPLYQDLSDHWTLILQRLYPVWALIGPGLADPGHIELRSRSIYLDSDELLGPRAQIAAGQLQARAVLRCFGVALHETFHAKHTKRWAVEHDLALADSTTRPSGSSPSTGGCWRSRGWRPTACASSRRERARALRAARARGRRRRRDPAALRRAARQRRARRPAAHARHGRARERLPAGAHALRDRRPAACSPRWRRSGGRCSATPTCGRSTTLRPARVDRRRRARRARRRRARLPRDHRRARPAAVR